MCGISGMLSSRAEDNPIAVVDRINRDQRMRGPDAAVSELIQSDRYRLALGHTRLSIIDLSSHANQPMTAGDGRFTIVFNGEIYNYVELRRELEDAGHRFATQSDTEVLIAAFKAWGLDCLDRLCGMFAFALFDRDTAKLTLVRDRFGVKPLYWHSDDRRLVFASTPGEIARTFGLGPDLDYLAKGIRLKYYEDDGAVSPFAGLRALEPGCCLVVDLRAPAVEASPRRYYDLDSGVAGKIDALSSISHGDALELLDDKLWEATRIRLRSDVPLGLSVSGGVDSALISSLMKRGVGRLTGYSFAHPDAMDSEGPLVSKLAEMVGFEPRYVWPEGEDYIVSLFERTLLAQGAPFPHPSMMAQFAVFEAAKADGTTVMLGGQGGDEGFMGYRKFFMFYVSEALRRRSPGSLLHAVSAVAPAVPAIMKRLTVFWGERHRYFKASDEIETILRLPETKGVATPGLGTGSSVRDRQVLDVTRFSLPTLLRYEDRNSMGNSIESRLPFMDHRVLEYGIALPIVHKLGNGFGKSILRDYGAGKIPDSIRLNRDKRGFDVRARVWMDSGLGDHIRSRLRDAKDVTQDFVDPATGIDDAFSNEALASNVRRFTEATTLIWLGDRALRSSGHAGPSDSEAPNIAMAS
ncbi:MAG: asparagine synthase (glutamine-hydrolyzing) [Roseitalea sp.]|jgi:asparagine synthase (glutamine-hydrolysing)|nr:asparagine synthase (glutamine-hydrolyzing) [Roseitalea sp.]MBO6722759.1 asparagine synthase (glutamine-hydrolyzing) [Roseitalea sp.]MBO6745167.1 asparagine synthase (glutamine-hydrolyzing) [Roseitalea sp.]